MLWPAAGLTKGEAIDYYQRVADVLLPHIAGRPLTLRRFPDGIEGEAFYEKRCPGHAPDWVRTARIRAGDDEPIDYCVCDHRATLAWLGQLAALELHPSLSLAEDMDHPTAVAFDLDPGAPATIAECCRVALMLRNLFGRLGLEAFAKTSGSKGLQVYLPLNRGEADYEHTKSFARAVAQSLERAEPGLVVSRQLKELRTGKVLVDWSQNDRAKTTVAVYSLRWRHRPGVSTPLRWEEVADVAAGEASPDTLHFEGADVLRRVADAGDLFAGVLEMRQDLPRP